MPFLVIFVILVIIFFFKIDGFLVWKIDGSGMGSGIGWVAVVPLERADQDGHFGTGLKKQAKILSDIRQFWCFFSKFFFFFSKSIYR
jgi:hypothetical protein